MGIAVGIAVSGGPDSLGLVSLAQDWAARTGAQLHALIVDHQLRAESSEEAGQVRALLIAHGIQASVLKWHQPRQLSFKGKQRAARWARYALLADAAQRLSLDRVWLGHTHEDQAETLWMRWLAGSGLWGLAGLSAQFQLFDTLFERPVLGCAHADLRQQAVDRFGAQRIVDDPTNADVATWRGRARLHYGRGLIQHPYTLELIAASSGFARWRRRVEETALSLRADGDLLPSEKLRQHPAASAAWLSWQAQQITQREHAIGFHDSLTLVHSLSQDDQIGQSRGRRTKGGVLIEPTRSPDGGKGWRLSAENLPTHRKALAHKPGHFWRRLFEYPSALLVKQAYTSQRPLFTIATSSFATTLG